MNDLVLAAGAGMVFLAISATLWALASRRRAARRVRLLGQRLNEVEQAAAAAVASAENAQAVLISHDRHRAELAGGRPNLAAVAGLLGSSQDVAAMLETLAKDPLAQRQLHALFALGQPCAFETAGGRLKVEGGPAGATVWLKLTPVREPALVSGGGDLFSRFLDGEADPAWIARAGGALVWANRRWLEAVDAKTLEEARTRGLAFDKSADGLIAEAAEAQAPREAVRWLTAGGARRAFRLTATPLAGGEVGVRATDVTETETLRDEARKHDAAHGETLNHIADAVAIFNAHKVLTFHNLAFANLWGLEPAWLAEGPTHSELLDRLRQRRRLPETADYAKWKAGELAHYESLDAGPDDLWTLPDGRTLRVVRQPHPAGGLLLLFSDITGELRLKAQYNALIQVQQATLDKLNDAVVVFASDGRLRLHNEAFERFFSVSGAQLEDAGDFDGVRELCTPKLHDLAFWTELKGRVTDTDPRSRVPTGGEGRTGDDRIISWQSRPLPDGATLIAFDDITDARKLEKAVQDRSAALAETERLKRDFVGNVSYELRTPLTTIIGYSELLDHMGEALPERLRGHVGSVRSAAKELARSIDDVLDTAQIDAGEMALDHGDVVVRNLLDQAAERFAREAAELDVRVEVACGEEVGAIRGDAMRLGQALDHLLENALRQSPRGGVVTLTAHRAASEITLKVTDRGRGIPFHVQAHIFDRFVGRERGGPGLGLALVKALVELHGGWVALESEPGAGATFTLHLPEVAYSQGAREAELF